jgi:hypothetical protein
VHSKVPVSRSVVIATGGGGDAGLLGCGTGMGSLAVVLGLGAFIASRMYGTATAPMTPRTMSTRTARNHVAAKIERGAVSSNRSCSEP